MGNCSAVFIQGMREEKLKKVVIYQYSSCEKRKNCVTIEKR
jgi:hypothetical protein